MSDRQFPDLLEIDIRKLRDCYLNPNHPDGRDKARVFRSALGISQGEAEWLRNEILRLARDAEAVLARVDAYGARFHVDLLITRLERQAMVRTAWIVSRDTGTARLIHCRVL
jgi:hypothetical protein